MNRRNFISTLVGSVVAAPSMIEPVPVAMPPLGMCGIIYAPYIPLVVCDRFGARFQHPMTSKFVFTGGSGIERTYYTEGAINHTS